MTAHQKSRRWTPEEKQELTRLAARGVPVSVIADMLGRSAAAIRTKAAHARLALVDPHTSGPQRMRRPWDRD